MALPNWTTELSRVDLGGDHPSGVSTLDGCPTQDLNDYDVVWSREALKFGTRPVSDAKQSSAPKPVNDNRTSTSDANNTVTTAASILSGLVIIADSKWCKSAGAPLHIGCR